MAKKRSKRYRQMQESAPTGGSSLGEAMKYLKGLPPGKFDQTVELVMSLGIDPRQADQALRGSISLPHGIGGSRRVIAFCEGEDVEKAQLAGAVEVGADELIEKIQGGWMDFDVAVATPAMMRRVSRLGRILGPQGKMPSPKAGTVSEDVATTVEEYAAGKMEYRNDDGGNMHVPVGKMSLEEQQLVENAGVFIEHIRKRRPGTVKGAYIKKVSVSASMTPGVQVELQ